MANVHFYFPLFDHFYIDIYKQITMMINNINSTIRPQSGKSPAAMAMESFGEDVMKKLGLTIVEPDEVHLMPSLLK